MGTCLSLEFLWRRKLLYRRSVQGVSKMFWQIPSAKSSGRFSFTQIYVPKSAFFFCFNSMITFYNKHLTTMQYFTYGWYNTITVLVHSFIYAVFLIIFKSQITRNVQKILQLNQCMHAHVWSSNVSPFERSQGGCKWSDRHKNGLIKCLFQLHLELNTAGNLVTTHTKIQGTDLIKIFACNWKTVCGYILMYFLKFWCGYLTPEFFQAFQIHSVCDRTLSQKINVARS
jgi:hypothetical protein